MATHSRERRKRSLRVGGALHRGGRGSRFGPFRECTSAGSVYGMGAGTEAMLVGLGLMALCGFLAVSGLSFDLTPEQEKVKDYHWAWVKGQRWPALFFKYVGLPLGALIFLFGVGASLIDVFA